MKGHGRELHWWLVQRASAVCMLFFILFVLVHFMVDPPNSYAAWHEWVMRPDVSAVSAVFFAALLAHAWTGLRVVIMDYVHPAAFRSLVLVLVAFGLVVMAVWIVGILLRGRG